MYHHVRFSHGGHSHRDGTDVGILLHQHCVLVCAMSKNIMLYNTLIAPLFFAFAFCVILCAFVDRLSHQERRESALVCVGAD